MNSPTPDVQDVSYHETIAPNPTQAPVRHALSAHFMMAHPAHVLALGFGAGLSPRAPGTMGTLLAWVSFAVLQPHLGDAQWAVLLAVSLLLGWWACARTARLLGITDPGAIVWDEVVAFWLVLWLISPTTLTGQAAAFACFRLFDALKPGPVGWADRLFHALDPARDRHAWHKASVGILLDDLVAAFCTLLLFAAWRAWA